jgi:hypothetical protein
VNLPQPQGGSTSHRGAVPTAVPDKVVGLVPARIERALVHRARYHYVQPRVEREGRGWKIVSPNCSRQVDPQGGEIAIAWFEPLRDGRWALYRRDHARAAWCREAAGLGLDDALARVCNDPLGRFWP